MVDHPIQREQLIIIGRPSYLKRTTSHTGSTIRETLCSLEYIFFSVFQISFAIFMKMTLANSFSLCAIELPSHQTTIIGCQSS